MVILFALIILIGGFYLLRYVKQTQDAQNSATEATTTTPTSNITTTPVTTTPTPDATTKTPPATPDITDTTSATEIKTDTPEKTMPPTTKSDISKSHPKKTNGTIVTGTPTPKTPDEIVKDFYSWYTKYEGDAITDGSYKTRNGVTADLIAKVERVSKLKDPFLYVSKPISNFEVEPPKINGENATVAINIKKSGKTYPIKISLKKNGSWKMINVTILSQNGERGILETFKEDQGLDYLTVKDTTFYWNLPDWKGRESQKVNGKNLKTDNAELTTDVKTFLENQGYKADTQNNGYKKDRTVCMYSDVINERNKHDIELKCGEIMYNY